MNEMPKEPGVYLSSRGILIVIDHQHSTLKEEDGSPFMLRSNIILSFEQADSLACGLEYALGIYESMHDSFKFTQEEGKCGE